MYKITVEKITKENRVEQEWRKLTDKEDVEQQYGYVESENEIETSVKIYEQLLENINIADIVMVLNTPKLVVSESKLKDK